MHQPPRPAPLNGWLFRTSAALALALHAALLWARPGLHGGADLYPHLALIRQMAESPALRNVYPPLYHALGALLAPLLGLEHYPQWLALLGAAALIAGFRSFQRAAGLPEAASALFALAPYSFALTQCLPKVETLGYACALAGLAALLARRHVWVAVALVAAFWTHTATALVLGLCGGALALARRDWRGIGALAAGTLLALPLPLAHLRAGCSLGEAFLFSQGDYLRAAPRGAYAAHLSHALLLANPVALALAAAGAATLWRARREIAWLCALLALLCLNELWLAPFGARTTLDLVRGLTLFAVPVSAAAGMALEARPRGALAAVAASAALSLALLWLVVPQTCVSRPIDVERSAGISVDRCRFRWRELRGGPERQQVLPELGVERPADLERATQ
jgi:hypothetical protein